MRRRRGFGSTAVPAFLSAAIAIGIPALAGCGGGSDEPASTFPAASRPEPAVRVGGTPTAIAVGEGGVWVADNSGARVIRLDPRSGRPLGHPSPVGQGPLGVAVGEGGVWVASGDGSVDRIDPGTGEVTPAKVRVAAPGGIAAGEGSVWVTSSSDDTVTRIDPATSKAIGAPIQVGARPADVAVGDGSAWVANTDDGTVTRIDAGSGEAGEPIQVADQLVLALTFGEDGVWAATSDDLEARTIEIKRLDPTSGTLDDGATALAGAAIPIHLAAGEGAVWGTLVGRSIPPESSAKPAVAVLDPESRELASAPVPVGKEPSGIAVGEGAVWVANAGDGTVTRILPHA